ncbi:MAG: phytoene desaturase family protein [Candidatus Omnitrophica bacterium]|nr:phytoene desaturase family protein [Candidatus Omnitrophota bacterium]
MKENQRIAIIGAGVGGLSAAARLSFRGFDVDVFEKLDRCGGRNNLIEDKGFKFDTGPSFVLMPDFFEEVFLDCSEKMSDYLDLKVLETNYKIFYSDGDVFSVFKDLEKTKAEIERFEQGGSIGFDEFIKKTENFYKAVRPLLFKCFTKKALLNPRYWKLLFQLEPFSTYWNLARKFFKNEKLCYAFTFEAMFMGVSPFEAPAFYSIISYADHIQKIAHPMGGMYEIPKALEKIAIKNGAKFHYNSEVKMIYPRSGQICMQVKGESQMFDKVIINADYAYVQEKLLKRKIPDYQYSCSVFLLYLGLKEKLKNLDHHNLFFADDLRKNLNDIFKTSSVSLDPSFYVHVPTVTDLTLAPKGKEIAYILIPVPNLEMKKDDMGEFESRMKEIVFEKINQVTGQNIESLIEVEHKFYPNDFIARYNIKNGATFGLAHNLFQSAFFRPPNIDSKNKNIFYVGASTQPGGGLPVVMASSKIVSDIISEEKQESHF